MCTKVVVGFGMELNSCSLTEYACKLLVCCCLAVLILRCLSHVHRNCFILTKALFPAHRLEFECTDVTTVLNFLSVSLYLVFYVYYTVVT